MAVTLNQRTSQKRVVVAGNNQIWSEVDVAGTLVQVAGVTVDTTDQLNLFAGGQKAFVINGANLKVIDFVNTKLVLNAVITGVPVRGATLTQAVSGATMVIDFVVKDNGDSTSTIYGYTTSGTFDTTNTVSATDLVPTGMVPSSVDEAATAPHGYDLAVYPDGTSGSLPAKAYLGCWYRGRVVLSGDPDQPHQWYMSRQLDPTDWFYTANDAQSPVAGQNGDAGEVGDIVRALVPFHDDYLIFGCASSIHYLQGDPAAGGELHPIDDYTGMFGAMSWCFDKKGDLYFFGTSGVGRIKRGTLFVENLSGSNLPKLLEDEAANPTTHRIVLGYDSRRNAVIISITLLADGSNSNYYYDITAEGFFPETYPNECGAYSMFYYPANDDALSDLLIGCKDGYTRHFSDAAKDDNIGASTQAIESNVLMPVKDLDEEDEDMRGRVNSMTIETSGGSVGGVFADTDSVTYEMYTADGKETLVENVRDGATPLHTGTLTGPGRMFRIRDKARGKYFGLLLKNISAASSWALEKASIKSVQAGKVK